jgi:hypothetical protein
MPLLALCSVCFLIVCFGELVLLLRIYLAQQEQLKTLDRIAMSFHKTDVDSVRTNDDSSPVVKNRIQSLRRRAATMRPANSSQLQQDVDLQDQTREIDELSQLGRVAYPCDAQCGLHDHMHSHAGVASSESPLSSPTSPPPASPSATSARPSSAAAWTTADSRLPPASEPISLEQEEKLLAFVKELKTYIQEHDQLPTVLGFEVRPALFTALQVYAGAVFSGVVAIFVQIQLTH